MNARKSWGKGQADESITKSSKLCFAILHEHSYLLYIPNTYLKDYLGLCTCICKIYKCSVYYSNCTKCASIPS